MCDSDDVCPGFDDYGVDDDHDLVPDVCDNCPGLANSSQGDLDLDGFGDDCDCDPIDDTQHPGALEICNEEDDDCDALVDNDAVDAPTWYVDADGDGQGDPDNTFEGWCENPGGAYVDNADDCNDASSEALMGGFEECDGLDNDCDGTVDGADVCVGEGNVEQPVEPSGSCDSTGPAGGAAVLLLLPLLARRRSELHLGTLREVHTSDILSDAG